MFLSSLEKAIIPFYNYHQTHLIFQKLFHLFATLLKILKFAGNQVEYLMYGKSV